MMEEESSLLHSLMYKISEEDSQDEEVLSSHKSTKERAKKQQGAQLVGKLHEKKRQSEVEWPNNSSRSASGEESSSDSYYDSSCSSCSSQFSSSASCSTCESTSFSDSSSSSEEQETIEDEIPEELVRSNSCRLSGNLVLVEYFPPSKKTTLRKSTRSNFLHFQKKKKNEEEESSNFEKEKNDNFEGGTEEKGHLSSENDIELMMAHFQIKKRKEGKFRRFLSRSLKSSSQSSQLAPESNSKISKNSKNIVSEIIHTAEILVSSQNLYARVGGKIESVVGVKLGYFFESLPKNAPGPSTRTSRRKTGKNDDERIMVEGFRADVTSSSLKTLQIGDWLHTINGMVVTHSNLDFVLNSIEQRSQGMSELRDKKWSSEGSSLVELESDEDDGEKKIEERNKMRFSPPNKFLTNPNKKNKDFTLIYITSSQENPKISFCYPMGKSLRMSSSREKELVKTLTKSFGMFLTLYETMGTIDGCYEGIRSKIEIEENKYEVSYPYVKDGNYLIIFTLLSTKDVQIRVSSEGVSEIVRNQIELKFGKIERAFLKENEQETEEYLMKLFNLLQNKRQFLFTSLRPLDAFVPHNEKTDFDKILFETECHVGRDDGEEYSCIGTALFYQEKSIVSHFESELEREIKLWMSLELAQFGLTSQNNNSSKNHAEEVMSRKFPIDRVILWQNLFIQQNHRKISSNIILIASSTIQFVILLIPVNSDSIKREPDLHWIQKSCHIYRALKQNFKSLSLKTREAEIQNKSQNFYSETKNNKKRPKSNLTLGLPSLFSNESTESEGREQNFCGYRKFTLFSNGCETIYLLASRIEIGNLGLICSHENIEKSLSGLTAFSQTFHGAILSIHKLLNSAKRARSGKYGSESSSSSNIGSVNEFGVVIQKSEEDDEKRTYWLSGRIYDNLREVYIKYPDSNIAHSLLEQAFNLTLTI